MQGIIEKIDTIDASDHFKKKGLELSLNEKIAILNNIDIPISIDFSGSDPLVVQENTFIFDAASKKFGRKNISITTTGVGSDN